MFTIKSAAALVTFLGVVSPVLSQTTVRINALGDSITGSPGCWRALLWQKLQNANVRNTDFVGTLSPQGCGFSYDGENDGHGGFLATGIVRDNQLPGWLSVSRPDIVMMQLGTNDVWNNLAPATIIAALDTLVNQMRASKASMRILVAKITPMNPTGCSDCPQRVVNYNNAIAAWAPGKSTSTSPITVVDCWTGFSTSTDMGDGVHPNDSGNTKLANCWYEPLKAAIALAGGGSPTTTTRTTTTVSRTPTTQATTIRTTTTARITTTTGGSTGGSPLYGQCGGQGWTGPTTCAAGTCKYSNQWYSQCLN